MRKLLIACVLISLWPLTALAQTAHVGTAIEIVDGDTLIVDPPFGDSGEVRLVGIQAPKLPLGRKGFETWPLAPEAKEALAEIALGKKLALSFGGVRRDRYGRWLAHLHVIENDQPGPWVQGEMLRRGLARVYSFPDNRAFVEEMLNLERDARAAGQGIWALPYYAIRGTDPGVLRSLRNSFQVIEGRVADAAQVKGWTYLNFGADWRTDFTVAIKYRDLKAFDGILEPLTLKGQAIRVRGWLKEKNGPVIEVTHPEQIEVLTR